MWRILHITHVCVEPVCIVKAALLITEKHIYCPAWTEMFSSAAGCKCVCVFLFFFFFLIRFKKCRKCGKDGQRTVRVQRRHTAEGTLIGLVAPGKLHRQTKKLLCNTCDLALLLFAISICASIPVIDSTESAVEWRLLALNPRPPNNDLWFDLISI